MRVSFENAAFEITERFPKDLEKVSSWMTHINVYIYCRKVSSYVNLRQAFIEQKCDDLINIFLLFWHSNNDKAVAATPAYV